MYACTLLLPLSEELELLQAPLSLPVKPRHSPESKQESLYPLVRQATAREVEEKEEEEEEKQGKREDCP